MLLLETKENMNKNKLNCLICGKKTDDGVLLFTQRTFKKCSDILEKRRQFKLKFNDISLPSEVSTTDGYHSHCYRNFTAVNDVYLKKNKQLMKHLHRLRYLYLLK